MPIPDDEMLGPGLEVRLKAALDEVVPPSPSLSSARYRMGVAKRPIRGWRYAPALIAVAAAGVALTATAATGSPNPANWRDLAGSVIRNAGHLPGSSPKATNTQKPQPRVTPAGQGTGASRATPSSGHDFEPKRSPEPSDRHDPSPRPEPSPSGRPWPTPTPDPSGNEPFPTPTPSDHIGD